MTLLALCKIQYGTNLLRSFHLFPSAFHSTVSGWKSVLSLVTVVALLYFLFDVARFPLTP